MRWLPCGREVELHLSPKPARSVTAIEARAASDYQERTWATRKRQWVDGLATAWLVQRCIDKSPSFVWLADRRSARRPR